MAQEDKSLLFKDLSARQPHGVHCCVFNLNKTIKEDNDVICGIVDDNIVTLKSGKNECYMYYQIKPYLRPMSSMTEEEKKELGRISCEGNIEHKYGIFYKSQDYLNSIHVDYRGLMPMGLAIEVTKENNPYEE